MGSIIDAVTGRSAKKAGDTQAAGIKSGIDFQKMVFDYFKEVNAPFIEEGTGALRQYADTVLRGDMSGFEESPGYQYRLEQGQDAITNTAATRGGIKSGNVLKALTQYGQEIGSSEYGNYLNQLAGLSGMGQAAVGQQGSVGGSAGANIGAAYGNYGAARASGIIGQANTINSWLSQAGKAAGFGFGP
jgi:hypothetical protein